MHYRVDLLTHIIILIFDHEIYCSLAILRIDFFAGLDDEFFAIFKLLAIVIANDISERSFLYAAFHPDKVEEALIAVRLH